MGQGEGDRPLLRGGVGGSAGSTGGGEGAYSATPLGHRTIDPGSMGQPSTSRSQDGTRSRLHTEQTWRRKEMNICIHSSRSVAAAELEAGDTVERKGSE